MNESFDIVVAGGGIAGLVAAVTAGRGGARTLLLDSHPVGGRARSLMRDGFILNHGPHGLYNDGQTLQMLAALGIDVSGGPPMFDGAGALFGNEVVPLPMGARALLRSPMLSRRSRLKAAKLFAGIRRLDPAPWVGQPMCDWLATMPDDLAGLVAMLVRTGTYVDAVDTFDAAAAIMQLQTTLKGVLYLDGGWQRMTDGLLRVTRAANVELSIGAPVDRVESVDGEVAVSVGADVITAGAAIVAIGSPASTERVIGRPIDGADRIGQPVQASVLDLGVRGVPRVPLLFGNGVPLYLSTHAPTADLAPEGLALVSVMRYLKPGTAPGDPHSAQAELRELARTAGVGDNDIVMQRYLHRITVVHGYPTALGGGLAGRPPVHAAGIDNIYIAGDWVGPSGQLADASVASGAAAAEAALRSHHLVST